MADEIAAQRVADDPSGVRTTFDEIEVGKSLGSLVWSVTEASVEGLLDNDADRHEWYTESSPWGGPVATPMATYPPVRVLFTRTYNIRGVFYEFESEFVRPVHIGEEITITGRIADKWIKRDHEFVCYEAEGVDLDGQVVFRTRRTHALDYLGRSAPKTGHGIDSGRVS